MGFKVILHPDDKHGMIVFINETLNCTQRTVQWLPIKHGSGSRHQRQQPGFAVSVSTAQLLCLLCQLEQNVSGQLSHNTLKINHRWRLNFMSDLFNNGERNL